MEDISKQISSLVEAEVKKQTASIVNQKLDTIMEVVEAMRNGTPIRELDDEVQELEADLALAKEFLEDEKAKNEKLTHELERRKEENKKLLDMVGEFPKELHCDECGVAFEPIEKITKIRHAYCAEHAPNPEKAKVNQKYEDYITAEKRPHKALEPDVKFSELAVLKRSESQQARRAKEALEKEAVAYAKSAPKSKQRECSFCGKPTNKLYCTDKCRKDFEAAIHEPPKVAADLEPEEWEELARSTVHRLSQRPDAKPMPGR
jgi:chemotaxis protein histidine kinase CheA